MHAKAKPMMLQYRGQADNPHEGHPAKDLRQRIWQPEKTYAGHKVPWQTCTYALQDTEDMRDLSEVQGRCDTCSPCWARCDREHSRTVDLFIAVQNQRRVSVTQVHACSAVFCMESAMVVHAVVVVMYQSTTQNVFVHAASQSMPSGMLRRALAYCRVPAWTHPLSCTPRTKSRHASHIWFARGPQSSQCKQQSPILRTIRVMMIL
jgi:hypothetical protein